MIDIILGDCIEKLKSVQDGSIDLIIADPPYNVGFMQDVREKYRAKSVVSYDLFEAIPTV